MIRFLPSYVGSKKHWVSKLSTLFQGENTIEYFCGSSVLSANIASNAILNDIDEKVYLALSRFDEQIVPKVFTEEDYFSSRGKEDWWRYLYCLQRMSFSGVFRYSKNGYNVPIKKGIGPISIQEEYKKALDRWVHLNPVVTCMDYKKIPYEMAENRVAILDPPYSGSKASYNVSFDYAFYWDFLVKLKSYAKSIVVFDRFSNLEDNGIPVLDTRKMRVTGHYKGDVEAIAIFFEGTWITSWPKIENTEEAPEIITNIAPTLVDEKNKNRIPRSNICVDCGNLFYFVYAGKGRIKKHCGVCLPFNYEN